MSPAYLKCYGCEKFLAHWPSSLLCSFITSRISLNDSPPPQLSLYLASLLLPAMWMCLLNTLPREDTLIMRAGVDWWSPGCQLEMIKAKGRQDKGEYTQQRNHVNVPLKIPKRGENYYVQRTEIYHQIKPLQMTFKLYKTGGLQRWPSS